MVQSNTKSTTGHPGLFFRTLLILLCVSPQAIGAILDVEKQHAQQESARHHAKDGLDDSDPSTFTTQRRLPHIVMIVMDDLGSNDLGFHGTGIQTPTCDWLSKEGLYLDNYYVLPYCSPTRASLLSGRYPLHTGVCVPIRPISTAGLPLDDETLPTLLRRAGYTAHAVGKWHLGHSKWEQTPTYRGFQSFYGFYQGGQDYFQHTTDGPAYDFRFDHREKCGINCSKIVDERGNYSTHVFTREAIRVLKEYDATRTFTPTSKSSSSHQQEQPLFLYLAYQAVHKPDQVPQEYMDIYNKTNWTDLRKVYAGMLTAADEGIGNVTEALKKYGLWDDTLLIFTTDNGGPTTTCAVQGSSNFPRRGGKCSVYEGGTTGDAFLSGPAMRYLNIAQRTRFSDLMHVVDWFPTLAELANVTPSGNPLDGVSQWMGLQDRSQEVNGATNPNSPFPPARQEVFVGYASDDGEWYGPALRYGRWKIIQGLSGGPDDFDPDPPGTSTPAPGGVNGTSYLLYDLIVDKEETQDLSSFYPSIVQRLSNKLRIYQQSYVAPQANDDSSCPFTGLVNTTVGPTWYVKFRDSFPTFLFYFDKRLQV